MTFGDRLRAYREARGLTQADVAIRLGVQPSHVSHWECGGREPSMDSMRRLCCALDVSADWLLGFASPQPFPKLPAAGGGE